MQDAVCVLVTSIYSASVLLICFIDLVYSSFSLWFICLFVYLFNLYSNPFSRGGMQRLSVVGFYCH